MKGRPVKQITTQKPLEYKPSMNLVGLDGDIFSIMGRASQLLRRVHMYAQSDEMVERVMACKDYYRALSIISEYVDTELSAIDAKLKKSQKEKEGRDTR